MADQHVPTTPHPVRLFLRGGIIVEGDVHVKAGAYRQRVSDLLNLQNAPFLPVTDVRYIAPGTPVGETEAFLVRVTDIVAVDLGGASAADVVGPGPGAPDGPDRPGPPTTGPPPGPGPGADGA